MPEFKCALCGRTYELETRLWRCQCGGILTLDFTPKAFDLSLVDKSEWSLWRYRAFFPLKNPIWRQITLGEGMTPVVRGGASLLFKLDYAMPTLSFKDRGAALLMFLCKSIGVTRVIQDSSGNAGNSVAAYAARAGIECEIFVPKGTSQKKIDMIASHGAQVTIFDGSRDQTADACRKKADDLGLYYASHVYNSMFYEGTKTYIYEVFEQLGHIPQNIFVPVGNGTLFFGVLKGLRELKKAGLIEHMPKIIAVQSEKCQPLKSAFDIGAPLPAEINPQPTMAEGIAIGKPMRGGAILQAAREENMEIISCIERDILPARAALAQMGFYVEHTTAATYAAYLEYKKTHAMEGDSLIPLCGAGLKSDK